MEASCPIRTPRWQAYRLLQELAAAGIGLSPAPDGRLRAAGALERLTADDREALAALKPELLAILSLPLAPPPADSPDYRAWVATLRPADWQGVRGVRPPWQPADRQAWGVGA